MTMIFANAHEMCVSVGGRCAVESKRLSITDKAHCRWLLYRLCSLCCCREQRELPLKMRSCGGGRLAASLDELGCLLFSLEVQSSTFNGQKSTGVLF